jgi:hypothetical protein
VVCLRPTDGATGPSSHADWRKWLGNDSLLTPGLRESCRRTLEGFEQFCRKRGVSGSYLLRMRFNLASHWALTGANSVR